VESNKIFSRNLLLSAHSHFTNTGKVHWLKVYQLPQAGRAAKGKAIVKPGESGSE